MRSRLLVLIALVALGALVASVPASAASHEARAKKKACVLKKKAKCKSVNLAKQKIGRQNLAGAQLAGANLAGATLTGTNLTGADLTGANLRGATLKGVNLAGAKLTGATFAAARLSGVNFAAPAAGAKSTRSALNIFGCLFSMVHFQGHPINARCFGATLRGVKFAGADIANSTFEGADLTKADFSRSTVKNTIFSAALMAQVNLQSSTITESDFVQTLLELGTAQGATISGSDFAEALVDEFQPMDVLTKASSANKLRGTLGLHGTTSVMIDSARDTRASATVDGHSNSFWRLPTLDGCHRPCFFDGLADDTFTITISTTAGSIVSPSSGITCTGSGTFTCTGTLTGAMMSIAIRPAPIVTVDSVLQTGAATPMSKIRFETVAADGSRTILDSCILKASCAVTVAAGTWLRVSVFREHSNGYFGMNCPGETGDAFTNMLTEWPTGDDTLSGDTGDTTRYALRRICPAFEVTGNVTLTAVNDSPDGAPSG